MARTKSRPVQHIDPGHVSTRSDTGRRHRPKPEGHARYPERWDNYDPYHTGGLTPWSGPGTRPVSGHNAVAFRAANREWSQAHPRPAIDLTLENRVPALQVLARARIPGLARYALKRDGSFQP